MKYQGIFIADLHIGAMPRVKLQKELDTILYPYLETMDLDFVIFCGDYFDHKLYLNEENVKHFSLFRHFFVHLYRIVLLESNSVRAPPN